MVTTSEKSDRSSLRMAAGMTAGILAGAVMAVILLLVSWRQGNGFWFPTQLIGASVFGVSAILGGMAPAVTGLILHFVWSAILGGVFGSMIQRSTTLGEALGGGVLFGLAAWAVMTYGVIPWANPTLADRVALMPNWWFVCHLAYGTVLGSAAPILRSYTRSEPLSHSESERTRAA